MGAHGLFHGFQATLLSGNHGQSRSEDIVDEAEAADLEAYVEAQAARLPWDRRLRAMHAMSYHPQDVSIARHTTRMLSKPSIPSPT